VLLLGAGAGFAGAGALFAGEVKLLRPLLKLEPRLDKPLLMLELRLLAALLTDELKLLMAGVTLLFTKLLTLEATERPAHTSGAVDMCSLVATMPIPLTLLLATTLM